MRIGIKTRVFNQVLKDSIKKQKTTIKELSVKIGIGANNLSRVINFRAKPSLDTKARLAVALNVNIDDIFPEEFDSVYNAISEKREKGLLAGKFDYPNYYIDTIPELAIEARQHNEQYLDGLRKNLVQIMADVLNPNEEIVIASRIGADGNGKRTLEEVGRELGCTRENIRRIEKNAYKKMREHPMMQQVEKDYILSE